MAQKAVIKLTRRFLHEVERARLPVFAAVLYGSYARGEADQDSDIDLLVISAKEHRANSDQDAQLLWRLRGRVDYRIEPLLVSKSRWLRDRGSPMLASIRQEGRIIRSHRTSPAHV